jgi:photosystem I reaction center subunit XII
MNDPQILLVLVIAMLPAVLAIRLGTALNS